MTEIVSLKHAMKLTADAVDKKLDHLMPVPEGAERRVVEAMRYSMFAGGKRLRPFLVSISADLFGVSQVSALRVGAAVECVHCYSLIHDDLPAMDDDEIRRGRPTAHIEFDEATAVLAGDGLLTLAFEILAHDETHADPRVRCELVTALASSAGAHGMVGGQMLDLAAENAQLDMGEITRLQHLKTGALMGFSVEAGAILGKASQTTRGHLAAYARDLGLAFQIADDLLDVEGDPGEVGKATGKDDDAGKATLVSLLGIERARQQAQLLSDQAISHLREFGDRGVLLKELARFVINRKK